MEGCKTADL